MMETHPFDSFVPFGSRYLILGSFTGRQATKGKPFTDDAYDWFYGTRRNQFWPIFEEVYGVELKSRQNKQELLTRLGIAIADIIYQCERKSGSNADANLTNIIYAVKEITQIVETNQISKILFTSGFVETKFRRTFKDLVTRHPAIELVALPSPSPRYAQMTKAQKVKRYKELLPAFAVV